MINVLLELLSLLDRDLTYVLDIVKRALQVRREKLIIHMGDWNFDPLQNISGTFGRGPYLPHNLTRKYYFEG